MSVQGAGAAQPVSHLGTDILICGIGAERQHCQRRRFERRVETGFGERLQLGKAFRQGGKGKGLPLAARRLDGGGYRLLGRVLQLVKNTYMHSSSECFVSSELSAASAVGLSGGGYVGGGTAGAASRFRLFPAFHRVIQEHIPAFRYVHTV